MLLQFATFARKTGTEGQGERDRDRETVIEGKKAIRVREGATGTGPSGQGHGALSDRNRD